MFLLRSAFWLTIGFIVVAPHGTDFGAAATQLRDQAVGAGIEAGTHLVVGQMQAVALPDLLEIVLPAEAAPATPLPPASLPAFPRPRPAALG